MTLQYEVYAGSLNSSTLVNGTKNLLRDAATVGTGLIALITIAIAIKNGIAWGVAELPEKPGKRKEFITGIAIGVVVLTVSSLVTVIFSYYGGATE